MVVVVGKGVTEGWCSGKVSSIATDSVACDAVAACTDSVSSSRSGVNCSREGCAVVGFVVAVGSSVSLGRFAAGASSRWISVDVGVGLDTIFAAAAAAAVVEDLGGGGGGGALLTVVEGEGVVAAAVVVEVAVVVELDGAADFAASGEAVVEGDETSGTTLEGRYSAASADI